MSDETEVIITCPRFVAKDETVWTRTPTRQHQVAHNILRKRSGLHRSSQNLSIRDTFKKILISEIVDIIVRCTNKKAKAVYRKYNEDHPTSTQREWKDLTSDEFYAFVMEFC